MSDQTLIDELASSFSENDPEDEVALGLLDAMKGALDPIEATLAKLDEDIDKREQKVRELKRLRTAAGKILTSLRGTPSASSNGAKKTRPAHIKNQMSAESLETLASWIRDHFAEDVAFSAGEIAEHDEAPFTYPSISAGLIQLADASLIRLDHVGPRTRRNYKRIA